MSSSHPETSHGSSSVASEAEPWPQLMEQARALDDQLARVDLSPSACARIQSRLDRQAARYGEGGLSVGAWAGLAFGGGAAAAVTLLWLIDESPREPVVESVARAHVDGFGLLSRDCAVERNGDAVELGRDCHVRLDDLGVEMRVLAASSVVPQPRGVRVEHGWIVFDVEPVIPGESPIHVSVPSGRVDVLGTQFVVAVRDGGGQVELVEGKIAFTNLAGQTSRIEPGQRVAWSASGAVSGSGVGGSGWTTTIDAAPPVAASPIDQAGLDGPVTAVESDAASQSGTKRRSVRKLDDKRVLAEALEDVQRLRAVRRYRAALRRLEQIRRQVRDPEVREVLEYEAGTLLESSGQRQHACTHWRQHLRKHPDGRYRENVERRLQALGCG
ncbi:MAG: FecR domain-containing protein [Myxococcales bacterium FL481]|nr:MAG: FecR domain-containing protein [Myxococcales bacterium FL481]